MDGEKNLIQESLGAGSARVKDESYERQLAAYLDNPFYDLTRPAIEEYVARRNPVETAEAGTEVIGV